MIDESATERHRSSVRYVDSSKGRKLPPPPKRDVSCANCPERPKWSRIPNGGVTPLRLTMYDARTGTNLAAFLQLEVGALEQQIRRVGGPSVRALSEPSVEHRERILATI